MRLAIASGGTGWHVQDLLRAARAAGHAAEVLDFKTLADAVGGPAAGADFDALLVRTIPAGTLEQVVFRMDYLHRLHARGVRVVNPPRAVEACVSKYLTSARLADAGLPTPRTVICQTADAALAAFHDLGRDAVVKPVFGAEGRGILRLEDADLAWRTFRTLEHPGWDVRAFVLGDAVLGAMRRENPGDWRANVARGGTASGHDLAPPERSLAVAAARAVGAEVAGVDLALTPAGAWTVLEVNAVPGWRAFAEVSGHDVAAEVVRYVTATNASSERDRGGLA